MFSSSLREGWKLRTEKMEYITETFQKRGMVEKRERGRTSRERERETRGGRTHKGKLLPSNTILMPLGFPAIALFV